MIAEPLHLLRRTIVIPVVNGILFIFSPLTVAAMISDSDILQDAVLDTQKPHRQQTRERALLQRNLPESDARPARPEIASPDYPVPEPSCVTITTLRLEGDSAARFRWALEAAEEEKGLCLNGEHILQIINKVQNAVLARGYVTTRVTAQEQDLTEGILTLTLQPGRIGDIQFEDAVSWRARLWNAIPLSPGEILNLRAIEQALENFNRVPSATADIKIVPGQQEATSDLYLSWKEGRPVRLSLGLDDSGSKSTGRYLGSTTLAVDAPFAQNDLFYANIGKDLLQHSPFGNRSHTLNYFFPVGYWGFSANYNHYTYHQNIVNAAEVLTYRGRSDNVQLTLSRLLFRNQQHKTTFTMRVWRRYSTNAVNDMDIAQQRRRTAGWELGLSQRSYLGSASLEARFNWRRGTAALGALRAPEEEVHSGSARTGIALGDISLNQPFALNQQPWRYFTSLRGQWSLYALTPQDRMAIAGRYTVRGFDGEQMLSGEMGILWRNELAWDVLARGHEIYAAVDYGRVEGVGTRYLAGHQLLGSALGVRGALWGRLRYELFAGTPLAKPRSFHTSSAALGFSVNMEM
ncbi:Putative activator or transporter protein of haemolysin-like protein [Erwinia tasmaniensis Et1/99]|uniref:Activator or transporter protein of haemolysin-like protein n=1 Tax=Erwinia tasmaniensis (strain DSM 17950 / CFBP 7177 / CIP 109463 / NCPPB 4357 / Et1/99) TaxID=465817 RepID=B2VKC3_ERWT9|nr:Putative activator or transporter protein of haemolysin-like protein [Erwinia tasmaniensis Et1/99]